MDARVREVREQVVLLEFLVITEVDNRRIDVIAMVIHAHEFASIDVERQRFLVKVDGKQPAFVSIGKLNERLALCIGNDFSLQFGIEFADIVCGARSLSQVVTDKTELLADDILELSLENLNGVLYGPASM